MPLLDLKTNLKDLKFGHDRYRGNSNEPFVVTEIPETNDPLPTGFSNIGQLLASAGAGAAIFSIGGSIISPGVVGTSALIGTFAGLGIGIAGLNLTLGNPFPQAGTGGPDFLLRGGYLLPNAIVNDEIRLAKYFLSNKGLLFVAKQNILSRTAVKTQFSPKLLNDGFYTPFSTLAQAAGLPFGLHVNKQGINPFDDGGLTGTREGGEYDSSKYFNVQIGNTIASIGDDFNNRLVALLQSKILNTNVTNGNDITFGALDDEVRNSIFGSLATGVELNNIAFGNSDLLFSYTGGPGAPLGIGTTNIRYATNNFGVPLKVSQVDLVDNKYKNKGIIVPYKKGSPIGYATLGYDQIEIITNPIAESIIDADPQTNTPISTETGIIDFRYPKAIDFRTRLKSSLKRSEKNTLMSDAPDYSSKNIELRVNLGDPGNNFGKNLTSYVSGSLSGSASPSSYDRITVLPIYDSSVEKNNKIASGFTNDLVKFKIKYKSANIHFRAFLNEITDQYTSEWDTISYIGRGEKFYNYSSFNRKVSLSWTVAAQSKIELIPMYKKLNFLASLCAPDYTSNGYMSGPIVYLTIGDYFNDQPGLLNGITYSMNDENTTWEIGIGNDNNATPDSRVGELPHMIKVSTFEFTPIHTFVPSTQQNNYNGGLVDNGRDDRNIYGPQRYINLNDTLYNI